MTFEQADNLGAQIVEFMRSTGGIYLDMPIDYLQWVVMTALGTRQFVIRISKGSVQYFACWWWLDDKSLERMKPEDPDERVLPQDVRSGTNFYIAEVAGKAHISEMMQRVRQKGKPHMKNSFWHRRNNLHAYWKENNT